MAVSQVTLGFPSGTKLFTDTDNAEVITAISASAVTLYEIEIDNTLNAAAASYLKLWNTASGSVTVGTTAPDIILLAPAAVSRTYVFPAGIAFATAASCATVTTAGTAGVTGPTSNVTVRIVYA